MRSVAGRIVAIDMVKGVAILWVFLIHAEVLADTFVLLYLINHAVPVFLVLFGVNGEQWWRGRTRADLMLWYRRYLRRIMLPVWAMLPVWWTLGVWLNPQGVHPSWRMVAANVAGYLPNVGTAWFVTLILQMVIVFPLVHFAARRLGSAVVLAGGLACLVLTVTFQVPLFWRLGPFNLLTFAPRMLGHVAFGLFLASRLDRLDLRAGFVALALWILLAAVQETPALAVTKVYAERLMDLPLTVLLLVLMDRVAGVPVIARPLGWLGVNSYGLYIGQMLVHNIVGFRFPFFRNVWRVIGHWPYALLLLLPGALMMVAVGNALLAAAGRAVDLVVSRDQARQLRA